jgi:hypothetical protein
MASFPFGAGGGFVPPSDDQKLFEFCQELAGDFFDFVGARCK